MIRYILFSLIVLSPLANIFAQDSLSIERAILIGLENNFQIQISNKEAAIAANNNSWGQAGAYPSINLNAFANGAITNNVFGQPLG
jgi:outer membrane protein